MKKWGWVVQYVIAIFLALLLGAILSSIQLFKETSLGIRRLTASDVVQFLGYGSALVLLWLLATRAASQLPEDRKGLSFLRQIVVPLAALIVVSVGYGVVWLLLGPFLDESGTTIYNWVFVLGIVGTALWLALASYRSSALLIEVFAELGKAGQAGFTQSSIPCPQCKAAVTGGMKFCSQCGQTLAAVICRNCGKPIVAGQRFCGGCGAAAG